MTTAKERDYVTELEQLLKDAEERASMFEMAGLLQFKEKEKLEQELHDSELRRKDLLASLRSANQQKAELEQELTKLKESQTQWINVKDRLPEPNTGETFIVYINEGSIQTSWYSQDEDFLNPEFDYTDVTHWMPLPEIPGGL